MIQQHFVNLTNGLEWIKELPHYSFIRLESTALEKKDYNRVLRDLDNHFLMCLALGHDCHFYDCGTRRQISKTVSVGLPFILDYLKRVWFSKDVSAPDKESQEIKRKFRYFRRYLKTDVIRLTGHSRSTENDGNKVFYTSLV